MIPDLFRNPQPGADRLIEGFYLIHRRRAQRVAIPVWIRFGPALDPDTGDELDRAWRWQIQVGDIELGDETVFIGGIKIECLADIWPVCSGSPIDEPDYRFRMDRASWAAEFDPQDVYATHGGRIDPMTVRLPFMDD